jgi:hypothetical protein
MSFSAKVSTNMSQNMAPTITSVYWATAGSFLFWYGGYCFSRPVTVLQFHRRTHILSIHPSAHLAHSCVTYSKYNVAIPPHKASRAGPWLQSREEKKKSNISWTNLLNVGLTSADRSNKATLLLTVPRPIQVVCKGFTPAHINIAIREQAATTFP